MNIPFKKVIEYNWIHNGVLDLFLGTILLDSHSFPGQCNNLCFQAIEKIGKGTLIMTPEFSVDPALKSNEYPTVEKRIKIFSHDLVALVKESDKLHNLNLEQSLKQSMAVLLSNRKYTLWDFLTLFSKREYLDSKYPSHSPTYQQFPLPHGFEAIMHGSLHEELTFILIRNFLRIARNYDSKMIKFIFAYSNMPKQATRIEWRRFRNLVWGNERI